LKGNRPKILVFGGRTPAKHQNFRLFLGELRKSYYILILVQNGSGSGLGKKEVYRETREAGIGDNLVMDACECEKAG
jgi:hypothetical protein